MGLYLSIYVHKIAMNKSDRHTSPRGWGEQETLEAMFIQAFSWETDELLVPVVMRLNH